MLLDFTDCPKLDVRQYDGASYKYAVLYNNDVYLLKFEEYPRRKKNLSHTGHHISEHIGSQIFKSMGLPTQETLLVKRGDKIAVACKDFRSPGIQINSFAGLIKRSSENAQEDHLEDTLETIRTQKFLDKNLVMERYWNMFVVDAFIANTDRHNGNWSYLVNEFTNEVTLAPIYDCGSSLFPLLTEEDMSNCLKNESIMKQLSSNEPCSTIRYKGAKINFLDFCRNYENSDFLAAVKRIVPRINMDNIKAIITNTPVITDTRKEFLVNLLTLRKELLLEPALKRAIKAEKEIPFTISKPIGKGMER